MFESIADLLCPFRFDRYGHYNVYAIFYRPRFESFPTFFFTFFLSRTIINYVKYYNAD